MANNKAIQILRGSRDYDPSEINNELLDGQPFYSKKNEQLYVGDKSKVAETDANGNPTSYITRPVGAAWIKPGEGKGSFVSACLEYKQTSNEYPESDLPKASGHESIAFGLGNTVSGDRSVTFGYSNESRANNTLTSGYNNKNNGSNSLIVGVNNNIQSSSSITGGSFNKADSNSSENIISGDSNEIIKTCGSIISGSGNKIGHEHSVSSNNVIYSNSSEVIECYNIVNGQDNYITANYNIVNGHDNESTSDFSLLLGSNLQSTQNSYKTALGYYNADLSNSLFEIGNGNSSSGKNAFSVNTAGDAFVQNRLTVGREYSGDPDASLFVADENGDCLLNLTPHYTILNPTESGYQFSMHREASSPEDDDFIIKNSTQNFVIARSCLLADDINQTDYRYAEFGSGDGLKQVSLGDHVVSTKLGYDGYTSIGDGTFRTFGIYSNASNGKYMQLGYWDSEKPIDNIYLTATDQFNFNLSGSDKFNISKATVTSKVPFVSNSSITSGGSISVGADLLLTNSSNIIFKYIGKDNITEKQSKIYHSGGTIYTNSDNLIIQSPVEVRGSLICNTSPSYDTSVIRKKDLYIDGSIVPEYAYDRRSRVIWLHKSNTNELTWTVKDETLSGVHDDSYFSDINNFIQPGIYKVMSDIAARQILNLPEPYAGVLEVHFGAKDLDDGYGWSYPIQDYMTVNGKTTYRRHAIHNTDGSFNYWAPWYKIGSMTALNGYNDNKGSIEDRLTNLGFKSGAITFCGTSYSPNATTAAAATQGLFRQGNYVIGKLVLTNKAIYLPDYAWNNVLGRIPDKFRPAKAEYISITGTLGKDFSSVSGSSFGSGTVIMKINTNGSVERVESFGDTGVAFYGDYKSWLISFGYEALPLEEQYADGYDIVLYTRTATMDGGRTRVVYVYFDTSSGKKPKYVYFNGVNQIVSDNKNSSYPGAYYISIYKDGSTEMPNYPAVGTLLDIIYE